MKRLLFTARPMRPGQWLAIAIVAITLLVILNGCGVTEWQRMYDARDSLHTPEMEKAIAEAKKTSLLGPQQAKERNT